MPLSLPSDPARPVLRSLDEVVSAIEARISGAFGSSGRAAAQSRLLIGIAGSPGSGKSTLGAHLVAQLNRRSDADRRQPDEDRRQSDAVDSPSAVLLPMDGFHLPQARLVELGRRDRMGAPDTFDAPALERTLRAIRADAGPVRAPAFDRSIEEPVPDAVTIGPAQRLVIVEGNYLLLETAGWAPMSPLLDVSFFVGVGQDIRLSRLVARHERFGKSPADALAWATGPDEANAQLIEATATRATYVVQLG